MKIERLIQDLKSAGQINSLKTLCCMIMSMQSCCAGEDREIESIITVIDSMMEKDESNTLLYIAHNAGCDIWEVCLFDEGIDWHHNEFQGTFEECEKEVVFQMNKNRQGHYPNASYGSIWDY